MLIALTLRSLLSSFPASHLRFSAQSGIFKTVVVVVGRCVCGVTAVSLRIPGSGL